MGNEQEKQAKIIVNKRGLQSYTVGWLNYIAEWSGITKEDVELISICDINDMDILLKPKTRKLRIVGGSEAFNDTFYLMFADALVLGEGFEFFKDYKKHGLEYALNQPYVMTKGKSKVVPSTLMDWNLAPD